MINRRSLLKGSLIGGMAWMTAADALNGSTLHEDHNNYIRGTDPSYTGFCRAYPATYDQWGEAFLAGNGKMGIMVFGNPLHETIVFNDRGFNLSTGTVRRFDKMSGADLDTIRNQCVADNYVAADKLAATAPHWENGGDGSRHPGFAMFITISPAGDIHDYRRTCNFRTGEIMVRWADDRGQWERKAFVSRKDNVIVQSLTAPAKGTVSCSIRLGIDPEMRMPREMIFAITAEPDVLKIWAKYKPNLDAGYEGVTRVIVTGGACHAAGGVLHVTDARAVLLLSRTKKYPHHCEAQWNRGKIRKALSALSADYETLLQGQMATHTAIYDRVRIDLDAKRSERAKTNDELLELQKYSSTPVLALWERIFAAGRYYFLSASSDETPPDLLGMWTGNCNAGWGGFYVLDANVNLQIGGGNIGAMPEAMAGYFKTNEAWRTGFQVNARKLLGCRGMVAAGNTPGPQSGLISGISVYYPYQYATGEEGWLLYPFWEHYLITGDKAFLRKRLYPLLKDMGNFYEDFLVSKDGRGHYIFAGSISPENQPSNVHVSLVNNSTFDISGARFCLKTLIETCSILGLDQKPGGDVERWTTILNMLPPYLINADGALKEWSWPGLDDQYNHRHSSHLVTVWPYQEITPATAVFFNAARVALEKRCRYKTTAGHGILHRALIAAGLKRDALVRDQILELTREGFYYSSLFSSHYPNHSVFCADTCNTMPTIMMEMLISSSPGELELLPALPQGLERGSLYGVKGRNRVTIEKLVWDRPAHQASCILRSDIDQNIVLIERDGINAIHTDAPVTSSPFGPIARMVQLRAAVRTPISLELGVGPGNGN